MSKAIKFNQSHLLVPGAVLFHVTGSGAKSKLSTDEISEFKITRSPYNKPFSGSVAEVLWMDGISTYINHSGQRVNSRDHASSLRDGGLPRDGRVHNLNRYFWTKEDAAEFIEELNSGVFSDPIDQAEYDHEYRSPRDEWSW